MESQIGKIDQAIIRDLKYDRGLNWVCDSVVVSIEFIEQSTQGNFVKSILESALLYACVTKSRDLDKKTNEVLVSFIYVFWMLKFSGHNPTERFNISTGMAELWCLVFSVFQETKSWAHQHCLVGEKLLAIAEGESIEAVRRMAMITTINVDTSEANQHISRFSSLMKHSFGNQLNWQLCTKEDAIMQIAANIY